MKRLIIFVCSAFFLISPINMLAQFSQPAISFDNLNHNFGVIQEEQGIVEHTFNFTNTGSEPLIIKDVRSSCGCTIAEWSKEPIMSMGKGSIKVSYNPLKRPGAFRKEITVISNSKEPNTSLFIVGLVEPKTKTIYDEYPIQMDGVRFRSNHLSVLKIKKGEIKTDTLPIYNAADIAKTITIPEHPQFLRFEVYPSKLMPLQKGEIIVHYDAAKKDDYGFVMDKVYLYFNDVKFQNNLLAVSATIEENFDNLTDAELAKAPKMEFNEEAFNFGTITQKETIKHTFSFKNTGKETLIIRKVSTTCSCTASEPSSYNIAPGQEGNIVVTFNAAGKIGKQFQTITLITNDPHKPDKLLRMIGTVEKPK